MTEQPKTQQAPCFRSLAFREIPKPDYADVCLAPLPEGAGTDPGDWAARLFSLNFAAAVGVDPVMRKATR